jgi:quercetin dioxygenase-like cupin family protein
MSAAPSLTPALPLPMVGHVPDAKLPWVQVGDGIELKVLRVVRDTGVWVVRNRFAPGVSIPTHKHTGDVHGFTLAGCWHYAEYGIDYPAGTYIYEPAGSIHTLTVNADNREPTDVLFVMQGSNLNLAADGSIWRVDDGPAALAAYQAICEAKGLPRPPVLLA